MTMLWRMADRLLRVLVVAALLALAAVGGLLWRLGQGPLSLPPVTPWLTAQLQAMAGAELRLSVGDTVLVWEDFSQPVEVRLQQVRLDNAEGAAVLTVPEVAVGFVLRRLVRGEVALARIAVIRPDLRAERTRDGRFILDMPGGGLRRTVPIPALPPASIPQAGISQAGPAAPRADVPALPAVALLTAALDALEGVDGPLATINDVSIKEATVALTDEVSGGAIRIPRLEVSAKRLQEGIRARLAVSLAGGQGRNQMEIRASHQNGDGSTGLSLFVTEVEPALLAPLVPDLARLRLPVSGRAEGRWQGSDSPGPVDLALALGSGMVDLPDAPLAVAGGACTLHLDPATSAATLERCSLHLKAPELTLTVSGTLTGGANLGGGLSTVPRGTLRLELQRDRGTARVEVSIIPSGAAGAEGAALTLRLEGLSPHLGADLHPALAPLAGVRLPLGGRVDVVVDKHAQITSLDLDLAASNGALHLPPLLPQPIPLAGVSLRAGLTGPLLPVPQHLDLRGLSINFGGPMLTVVGETGRQGDRLTLKGEIRASGVPVDDLPRLWPPQVGRNARDWITANLSVGVVDQAWLSCEGTAPLDDPTEILASRLDGGVSASNLTVTYFRGLPPVTGVKGEGTSDGRNLILHTTGGKLGDLALGPAMVDISKLDTPQEWIELDAPVSGPLATTLWVIDHPPLRYAHKLDIDPAKAEGTQSGRLRFKFPLIRRLELKDIEIGVTATLKDAAIRGLAGGVDASQGDLKLVLDNKGLQLTGNARVEGFPGKVDWKEAFADNANPRTRLALKLEAAEPEFAARGWALAPYVTGPVGGDVNLIIDAQKRPTLTTALNFARTRLAVPEIAWSKPAGSPGTARFTVDLVRGKPVRLSGLTLEAGDMKVSGGAELDPSGSGVLRRLMLKELRLGADTAVQGDLEHRADGAPWSVKLQGSSLDLRGFLKGEEETREIRRQRRVQGRHEPKVPGPRWEVFGKVDRLVTGDGDRAFRNVTARLRHDGLGFDVADFQGRLVAGNSAVSGHLEAAGAGHRVIAHAEDAGAVLRALDVTDSLRGGAADLVATVDPADSRRTLRGHLTLSDYRLWEAPLLARLLNAMSVTGLIELLQGEGVAFSHLEGDFVYADDLLTFREVRTAGAALGLTAAGTIDLARNRLDSRGTLVPAYTVNRILGAIPLLGDLLSGGAGQGIFAATYHMDGPLAAPEIAVNPLAMLAPGFLRNLFFLGDGP